MPKSRTNLTSGNRAGNPRSGRPNRVRADTMTTTVVEQDVKKLAMRLLGDSINAPVVRGNGTTIGFHEKHDNPFAINPPWGSIPFLLRMQGGEIPMEDILQALDSCAVAKNEFARRGQYYEAWQWGFRERMISRVLQGLTKFGITNN